MKVLIINSVVGNGSTGRIVAGLYGYLRSKGEDVRVAYGMGEVSKVPAEYTLKINNRRGYLFHNFMASLTDRAGFFSTVQTWRLVRYIKDFEPDVICLHQIHGYWINIRVLFRFLKQYNCPVLWTTHDCWSFTGHCAHFDLLGCSRWKEGCGSCPGRKSYPASWYVDNSALNYRQKKKLFLALGNRLKMVPISDWIRGLLLESFLKDNVAERIHNGIDLNVFRPVCADDLIPRYHLEGQKIVLGVALPWSGYKGLPDIIKLRQFLPADYLIVLIGMAEWQIEGLPEGILGITRTSDPEELVKWYSLANVFVNATYSDTYPTVNMEALSCGTPVVTYNTGGSPESVTPDTGMVVPRGDVEALANGIRRFCEDESGEAGRRAYEYSREHFANERCFEQYYRLMWESI